MADPSLNPEFSQALIPELSETPDGASNGEPEPSPQPAGAASGPIISFSHVSMSFDERKILDNVSFTVERGQTLCILGRSGVGKSVALRILMGFLKPQVGSIHVAGEEINAFNEEHMRAIRKKVTMVFQNGALFDSMSVRENVAFPLRERGGLFEDQINDIVDRLIKMVGAEDVADAFPASLSTGRKRAVAIARALAAQPEVVLYDEPTTMVDPIIARRLGDLIQRLKRQLGFTSIVVTHDMRFAERLADQVLFLDRGRASYFGPLQGFLESSEPNIQQFLALDAYVLPL
ncbi:MAG TPA: ATP-binding cassette domain-containing protein [Terracidiphilus sp.]|nr:ATP-binding cassette domain-containing protein [Terracidiphilus sp.]